MSPSEHQLNELEASLAGTLKRITPRDDYVKRLRRHIHFPQREEIATRLQDWRRLILVLGGVVSGTLIIITIARALYHLLGKKHLG